MKDRYIRPVLLLIFVILAAGIVGAGSFSTAASTLVAKRRPSTSDRHCQPEGERSLGVAKGTFGGRQRLL